jgi:hypothetical protein
MSGNSVSMHGTISFPTPIFSMLFDLVALEYFLYNF